ncbi:MAG: SMC-Scp complex subunit ScpB [Phycisphaeraceae bacterium]|nr:SMC-Scp complex subunit ScpB [Phycisphaeraceae bacterium]
MAPESTPESAPPEAAEVAQTPASPRNQPELALCVEAALLTIDRPMAPARLAELLSAPDAAAINAAVASLNQLYERTGRSFRVEQVAGGWQLLTLPRFAEVLAAMHRSRQDTRLSPAALETLAIVAYKQPILRAQVESIRGVACGEVLRSLMDRHLVKIVGRAEEIGRPMLYGTTKQFLEVFGLSSIKDLPQVEELKAAGERGK